MNQMKWIEPGARVVVVVSDIRSGPTKITHTTVERHTKTLAVLADGSRVPLAAVSQDGAKLPQRQTWVSQISEVLPATSPLAEQYRAALKVKIAFHKLTSAADRLGFHPDADAIRVVRERADEALAAMGEAD